MSNRTIHLGYEVGNGNAVDIPLRHMIVTGQTQEAGKTTTLEALITRSGLKAITFVTKRGEGSFAEGRRIAPYFREKADWQFVASILEASRGEKLKFERAWIIRASRGAATLADVQQNVRKALESAKGLSGDVYLTLDAYLEAVVPQIATVHWAKEIRLAPGVNVMDLSGIVPEMQHLVIRSTLDWVLNKEDNTVVVVPEAWKFIPQGRGTPVKLAAEAFIRQSAGLKNYLWLDSQDIAGVEKIILKSVPVWILGVQRESNEIERTLDNIPAGVKRPKSADIATLSLGQFYACWGTHTLKTYVQPAWMADATAREVAMGKPVVIEPPKPKGEPDVKESEAQSLRDTNAQLATENAALRKRLEKLESQSAAPTKPVTSTVRTSNEGTSFDMYEEIKARLIAEAPNIIRVLATKPEIEVEVKRDTITADGASLRGRLARLIARKFFESPVTQSAVRKELARTGPDVNTGNLSTTINDLVKLGFLTNESDGYRAVAGMKVNIKEV